jgi:hypothetical protein
MTNPSFRTKSALAVPIARRSGRVRYEEEGK